MAYMTSVPSACFSWLPDWIDRSIAVLDEPNQFIRIDAGDGFGLKLAVGIQNEGESGFTDAQELDPVVELPEINGRSENPRPAVRSCRTDTIKWGAPRIP
jgi:hypothetical protein